MKNKREAQYASEIEWSQVGEKFWEKVIWKDEKSGTYARLVRLDPGGKGKEILRHDFDELVYVLQGQLVNTRTGTVWHQGMLSSFPAGTEHGPFSTEEGIISIEFRYFSNREK